MKKKNPFLSHYRTPTENRLLTRTNCLHDPTYINSIGKAGMYPKASRKNCKSNQIKSFKKYFSKKAVTFLHGNLFSNQANFWGQFPFVSEFCVFLHMYTQSTRVQRDLQYLFLHKQIKLSFVKLYSSFPQLWTPTLGHNTNLRVQ